jgi:serine/threonine protein kinase
MQALIDKGTELSEMECKVIFYQLAYALFYAHNLGGICHRDIKPENVLIASQMQKENGVIYYVRLADWGFSGKADYKSNPLRGTYYFSPPERFIKNIYDGTKADVWSLGATLYNLLTKNVPFDADTIVELKDKVFNKEPDIPLHLSTDLKDLLTSLFDKDPNVRPTTEKIINHKWVAIEMPK